jgi:hypothetical protein
MNQVLTILKNKKEKEIQIKGKETFPKNPTI